MEGGGAAGNKLVQRRGAVGGAEGQTKTEREERKREKLASSPNNTFVAFSSAERRLSSEVCSSSSTRSLSSSATRSCFSNCAMSSSN